MLSFDVSLSLSLPISKHILERLKKRKNIFFFFKLKQDSISNIQKVKYYQFSIQEVKNLTIFFNKSNNLNAKNKFFNQDNTFQLK
jgi:hypothetical protein